MAGEEKKGFVESAYCVEVVTRRDAKMCPSCRTYQAARHFTRRGDCLVCAEHRLWLEEYARSLKMQRELREAGCA